VVGVSPLLPTNIYEKGVGMSVDEVIDRQLHTIENHLIRVTQFGGRLGSRYRLTKLFPHHIQDRLDGYMQNEFFELEECLKGNLWTAASLMALRIYDLTLYDYCHKSSKGKIAPNTIAKCLEYIADKVSEEYYARLDALRRTRNEVMHAEYQMAPQRTKAVILDVCDVVMFLNYQLLGAN
jgi:hypothetical protein